MKLGLGTVQFGLDYGITNNHGQVTPEEVKRIFALASQNNIMMLDTASLYGSSELIIGQCASENYFKIVTKTPKFSEAITTGDVDILEKAFFQSLIHLKQKSIYGLLIHDAQDLLKPHGILLWQKMQDLKFKGFVDKIGVSIYTAEQIDQICAKYGIDLIQVPINVFDQRLIVSGHLKMLKEKGIEIHARSVFLQGLLLVFPEDLMPKFRGFQKHFDRYFGALKERNCSLLDGALNFVLNRPEIDCVLVGVTSVNQLEDIIKASGARDIQQISFEQFAVTDEFLINPSCWR